MCGLLDTFLSNCQSVNSKKIDGAVEIHEDERKTLQHTGTPTSRVGILCVGHSCYQAKTGNRESTATSSQMGY